MNGRAAIAPCGHPGEVVIGTYVKCLKGCDDKSVAKPAAPVNGVQAAAPRPATGMPFKTGGLDAAERAAFDSEMVLIRKVAEKAAIDAEAKSDFLLSHAQCNPGAQLFLYMRGGKQFNTQIQSLNIVYEYSTHEIRAAQVAGVPLDPRKAQGAARSLVMGWIDSTMATFLDALPVQARGAIRSWDQPVMTPAVATDIFDDISKAVEHFMRNMYLRPNSQVLRVLIPIAAYNKLAVSRMPGSTGNQTVLDYIKQQLPCMSMIKSIEPSYRLKTHMVTAWLEPKYIEACVPIKFHQEPKVFEVVQGSSVVGYRTRMFATRADDVILYDANAVHYTTGIWQ